MTSQPTLLSTVVVGTALALSLPAQTGGPGGGKTPGNPPPVGRTTPTPTSSLPPPVGQPGENKRLIYFTGLVMLDDGSPPPGGVTIEIACGGRPKPYGVTDSTGAFSVNFGQPDATLITDPAYSGRALNDGGSAGRSSSRQSSVEVLSGCELSARLPGFRSEAVQLGQRRQLDDPNVGTIVMHRLANVSGYTFSMTTMNAPKRAQQDYEKGVETARKAKWPEAESLFRKAVTAYPKYAICWEALGQTLEFQKRPAEAGQAYEEAIRADARFVTPHLRLMVLSGREQRWEEVAQSAANVIQLDPSSYPIAYYFRGIAYSNLKRDDEAEKSVLAGLKVDSRGTVPRLNHLMGTLLIQRRAYAEALPYLRAYLQNQPEPADAVAVRGQIAYAEKMTAAPGPSPPER